MVKHAGSIFALLGLGFFLAGAQVSSAALTPEDVANERKLWPSRVAPVKDLTVQVVDEDLNPKDFKDIPKGQELSVVAISGSTLDVRVPGGMAVVFAEDTDLLERASYIQKHGREKPKPKPKPKVAEKKAPTSKMGRRLADKLVKNQGGSIRTLRPEQTKDAKYFVFYNSAKWCGPCRRFTPTLASLYNRKIKNNPRVELVFLSADRSQSAMDDYMKSFNMPWPAISYSQLSQFRDVDAQCGRGIPGMVIYSSDGRVYARGNRHTVMQKLNGLL